MGFGETISAPKPTLESCRIAFEHRFERSQLGALGSSLTEALVEVILYGLDYKPAQWRSVTYISLIETIKTIENHE